MIACKFVERSRRRTLGAWLMLASLPVAAAQDTRVFTDSAARRVTVPQTVQRVYPAGHPAGILLYTLAPDRMLGWTRELRARSRPFVPAPYRDLPVLGSLASSETAANVEKVLALRPDLVLDYGSVRPFFVSFADRIQEQTGLPYVLLDGRFEHIPEAYERLGALLGVEARAARLSEYARETLEGVAARVAEIPIAQRPRVYYARGPDGLTTGLAGSINVEVLERVGAVNVAARAGEEGGLAQVSMEQVLKWNPEIIITIDPNFREGVFRDPLWASVPAVENGRVHLAPGVPFGWFDRPPSVNRLLGVRWLARILYPEVFTRDLEDVTREFFRLFYHYEPTPRQLDTLLGGESRGG